MPLKTKKPNQTFIKCIRLKTNTIARQEFDLAYYNIKL